MCHFLSLYYGHCFHFLTTDIQMWGNVSWGGALIFPPAEVKSKELTFLNIWGACELKFGQI